MKNLIMSVAFAAVLLSAATAATAAPLTFVATLTGPAESPPNTSPGTGFATITIDPVTHIMTVQVNFSGLLGTVTAAHIHGPTAIPFAGTAGVATTTPTFPGFPFGVTNGTYDMTFDMTLASSYNPAFITAQGGTVTAAELALFSAIMDGRAYFNIHSNVFTGGEIRGFLVPIPEPATLLLLATGLGSVGVRTLRLRRSRRV